MAGGGRKGGSWESSEHLPSPPWGLAGARALRKPLCTWSIPPALGLGVGAEGCWRRHPREHHQMWAEVHLNGSQGPAM